MPLFGPPNVEKLGARRDIAGLAKALAYKKDWKVRTAAARALGDIGAPAVEPLIAALKDNGLSGVREAAAEALGKIGDPRAVEPLIAALIHGLSYYREAAAEALVKIGAPAVEPLIAALKDGDFDVRKTAAGALGEIGWKPDKGEAGALYLIARGKWDECVKIGAPAVEPLIAALKDGNSDVRKAAAGALGVIGDARAVRPLIAALEGSGMRQAAVNALVRLNNEGRLGDAERSLIHGLGQRYVG